MQNDKSATFRISIIMYCITTVSGLKHGAEKGSVPRQQLKTDEVIIVGESRGDAYRERR